MSEQVKNYIEENKDRFLNELFELLRIPSISADSAFEQDVHKAADYVKNQLEIAGAENLEIIQTAGYPIVYGEKIVDEKLPTVLVYGHYDVQPSEPNDLWETAPFEPTIRDNKVYARGAADDKGQMYMHVKALEVMQKTGALVCNMKFMIEGEEEIGSNNLEIFVKNNQEKLKADLVLISDTGIISNETPSICTGLRGLSYLEVELTGPNRDLHSGMYGGAVANPINVLCNMISSLTDENGKITIPNFYKDVIELSEEERKDLNSAPFSLEEYKKTLDIKDVAGEKGYTTIERTGIRPSLDVNGIWGGYTGEGAKTVLPSKAYAKISMRLVPNQKSEVITKLFEEHFRSIAPDSVKVKVTPHHGGEGVTISTDSVGFKAGSKAFGKVWGKEAIPTRDGGSIPIVAMFKSVLKLDSLLLGFGLDEDAIHSPNESYGLVNYFKGIETIVEFYQQYKKLV